MYALTKIKGVGRRYRQPGLQEGRHGPEQTVRNANGHLRRLAPPSAGELSPEELERIVTPIIQKPDPNTRSRIWFLNRQRRALSTARTRRCSPARSTPKLRDDWADEEDARPPRPASLLGAARPRPAHQDDGPQGPDRRCGEEEGISACFVWSS